MIEIGGEAAGYAHAIDAALLMSEGTSSEVAGTWTLTAFIGLDRLRGRGLGARALGLLAAETFATTLALACTTRAPVRNEAAVRAIEAQGFRWSDVAVEPGMGPAWTMRMERPYRR
ncbi:MAG: hypothetical protein JSS20_13025 [Proteobacteria bacterium]|nr:hypothetical protein [Pseudomonadota bacterium]